MKTDQGSQSQLNPSLFWPLALYWNGSNLYIFEIIRNKAKKCLFKPKQRQILQP